MYKALFYFLLMALPAITLAQKNSDDKNKKEKEETRDPITTEEEGVITETKSFVFGIKLINDGYGMFFELGRSQSIKSAMLYQLEISERQAPKQEKQSSFYQNLNPLIYGKVNFFYPVKLGVQKQFLLGNKSNKNGVNISGNVGGGFAAGLLRPYYVQINNNGVLDYAKFNPADSSQFLNAIGGPSFSKGWRDMTLTPGVYAKAALRFDYGAFNDIITGLELGVNAEYYTKEIPIMLFGDNKQFFFGAYVSLLFGKRK